MHIYTQKRDRQTERARERDERKKSINRLIEMRGNNKKRGDSYKLIYQKKKE